MTAPVGLNQAPTVKRSHRISNTTILILGVVVIPIALGVALNSYGPVTIDSALRMAAASVAGQTIAILSAITAIVTAIQRRYSIRKILTTVVIAAVVILSAISTIAMAGDQLLVHLDHIADINTSNQ